MVLMNMFGPKKAEVTGDWRKPCSDENRELHSSQNIMRVIISRMMRWAGHGARTGEKRITRKILVGKPKGKMPLKRS
jgi:hypothetical protein